MSETKSEYKKIPTPESRIEAAYDAYLNEYSGETFSRDRLVWVYMALWPLYFVYYAFCVFCPYFIVTRNYRPATKAIVCLLCALLYTILFIL